MERVEKASTLLSPEELAGFQAVLPELIEDIKNVPGLELVYEELSNRLTRLINYNVRQGKLLRTTIIILMYKFYTYKRYATKAEAEEAIAQNIKLVYILAWCYEFRQGSILIGDDMVDRSEMRRGQQCWHLIPEEKIKAPMDILMLESAACVIFAKYFKDKPYHGELSVVFHDFVYQVSYGKLLELESRGPGKINKFSIELFDSIAKHKTSVYSLTAPFNAGLIMAGVEDAKIKKRIEDFGFFLGNFYQVHDDHEDWTKNDQIAGCKGTDISNGRCTWVAVTAWKNANEKQRQLLLENYGYLASRKVEIVERLYEEIGIPKLFKTYHDQVYNTAMQQLKDMSSDFPKEMLLNITKKIFRRQ